MTLPDKFLQSWRFQKAIKHITKNARLLDIGCNKGELLFKLSGRIKSGLGIDPNCIEGFVANNLQFVKGVFPGTISITEKFDCITCLAVFEHVPTAEKAKFLRSCYELIAPNGRIIFTIPGKKADRILRVLKKLRLVHGMSMEQHHGYDPRETIGLAADVGFKVEVAEKFQLGLNNLFVFIKPV